LLVVYEFADAGQVSRTSVSRTFMDIYLFRPFLYNEKRSAVIILASRYGDTVKVSMMIILSDLGRNSLAERGFLHIYLSSDPVVLRFVPVVAEIANAGWVRLAATWSYVGEFMLNANGPESSRVYNGWL
jgi:hypothetical protein